MLLENLLTLKLCCRKGNEPNVVRTKRIWPNAIRTKDLEQVSFHPMPFDRESRCRENKGSSLNN